MVRIFALLAMLASFSPACAQSPAQEVYSPLDGGDVVKTPGPVYAALPASTFTSCESRPASRLDGNHNFDDFIGFISNPLFNIDPRAMTAIWPIFGYTHTSAARALPDADIVIPPSAGMYIALSERFSIGLNQGGYAFARFNRNQTGPFRDRFGNLRDRSQFGGEREGWLNLGGFAQYTLIQNVEKQFLLTAGLRVIVPTGSNSIFQGLGPVDLALYVTLGKGFGCWHVLATAGYQFPVGSGSDQRFYYGSVHLDRKIGWLYPLVEVNWIQHSTSVDIDAPTRGGFINLGSFESTGNLVSLAVGANAVLVQNKLEVGAVYTTQLYSQNDFSFDGVLVKMVIRY